jgi:putative ABC transport system ATP-binding protein
MHFARTLHIKMTPLIIARGLTKIYQRGADQIRALDALSFEVNEGEFLAIVGPSGSGKSTLLNLLGCMDTPTSGTLEFAGQRLDQVSEKIQTEFRRRQIGFVFQHFGLVPTLTVEENIRLPHLFARHAEHEDIESILEKIGLRHRRTHYPRELSGGEMQRVAIGRALFNKPKLLLADEPTGNLDTQTGQTILDLFQALNRASLTIIVVTHNLQLAQMAHRSIKLKDGKLET